MHQKFHRAAVGNILIGSATLARIIAVRSIRLDATYGVILNRKGLNMVVVSLGNHWCSVRRVRGQWYNLDSRLRAPSPLAENEVRVTCRPI
jgi:hypothetical protein